MALVTSASMIIPHDQLSNEALTGLIEAFVSREGTDYGVKEVPFSTKVAQVRQQLDQGTAVILYDSADQTFTIIFKDELPVSAPSD